MFEIVNEYKLKSRQIVEACAFSQASMNLKEGIRMTVNLSFGILRSKAVILRKDQETQRCQYRYKKRIPNQRPRTRRAQRNSIELPVRRVVSNLQIRAVEFWDDKFYTII